MLLYLAEQLRLAGNPGWGNVLDVARLLAYWAWLRPAWRCASMIGSRAGRIGAKGALILGLIAGALV